LAALAQIWASRRALESGKARLLSILDTSKETFKSFVKAFERTLLDCPQMAFHFRQRASFSQMIRLFDSSSISIRLRFTAEGGGSSRVALRQLHSKESTNVL
jgi:hypothetical protein